MVALVLRVEQGTEGRQLNDEADHHAHEDGKGDGKEHGQAHHGVGDKHREGPHHDHVALGEVQHAPSVVDQHVADGDKAIDTADGQALDQLL